MRSCNGCRWMFEGTFGADKKFYCRALPPVMTVRTVGNDIVCEALYPFVPSVRCGQYERRWFGRVPKVKVTG